MHLARVITITALFVALLGSGGLLLLYAMASNSAIGLAGAALCFWTAYCVFKAEVPKGEP